MLDSELLTESIVSDALGKPSQPTVFINFIEIYVHKNTQITNISFSN